LCERVVYYGEAALDEAGRQALLERLEQATGVSLEEIVASRRLSLLDAGELRQLGAMGIDVQLHTHRHRFPFEDEALTDEIVRNQEFVAACAGSHGKHLCYPSGHWHSDFWPVLRRCGVVSATTCDPGLNHEATPALSLCRFLDGEHLSELQFEAELRGFKQLLRDMAMMARGRLPPALRRRMQARQADGADSAPPGQGEGATPGFPLAALPADSVAPRVPAAQMPPAAPHLARAERRRG
jgi:peptidoglycan/xylan/chitin deacetylase (PgdA/CDA1 family)